MAQTIQGTDALGVSYTVTIEPYGDAFAVMVGHAAFNGGAPIAVTGVTDEAGGKQTQRNLADMMERANINAITALNGETYARVQS